MPVHLHEPADILVFEVAGSRYGVATDVVQELVRAVAVTPLPEPPPVVEGVINVRGTVVPVFDLRRRFHLPEKEMEPSDHLVVARAGERTVALHVDRVLEVLQVTPEELAGGTALGAGSRYVSGVAKLADGLVLIHDLSTFLSEAESHLLDASLSSSSAV